MEDVLIWESPFKLSNLKLLQEFPKARKNSENLKIAKKDKRSINYMYLRPFLSSFFKSIKQKFHLVLYTYMETSIFQSTFDKIEEIFGEDFFSAYISFPKQKAATKFEDYFKNSSDFLFEEENRTLKNSFFMDSSENFWDRNKQNCIPIPVFEGDPKDWMLFLWEKFIFYQFENERDLSLAIKESFYHN